MVRANDHQFGIKAEKIEYFVLVLTGEFWKI